MYVRSFLAEDCITITLYCKVGERERLSVSEMLYIV